MADYDPNGPGGMSDSDAAPTKVSSGNGGGSSERKPKGKSKLRQGLEDFGRSLNQSSVESLRETAREESERIPSYRKGGTKRGKGVARLHKNEQLMAPKKKRRMGRRGGRM